MCLKDEYVLNSEVRLTSGLYDIYIYVPYGCSICPVAQPNAGYTTGHPVIQPDARLRHLRRLSVQPPVCATGRFKSARLLNGAGMYLPGCTTTQAVGSFSSRYLREI